MGRKEDSLKWLKRRTEEYRLKENDTSDTVDDFDEVGKLGCGFSSVDELEEIDIGSGSTRCPTNINAGLTTQQKR
jgi:phage anti-repressor protein